MKIKNILTSTAMGVLLLGASLAPAFAATTVVVTPSNTQGWSTADTRPGGSVNYVSDVTSPYPNGALQLTTDNTTAAKAQYLKEATGNLSDVTTLSYWTKQVSGPVYAAPSYQLLVDLNGDEAGGFTTFVFEPYENPDQGALVPNVWQQWDVDAGQMWSSRSFSEGTCTVSAGAGGAPFYNLTALKTACPNAKVLGFGVNIGTYNPGYNVYTDGVTFNDTTYDFEQFVTATNKDQCKNGGYMNVTDASGNSFKNQGECVSYVVSHGKNK